MDSLISKRARDNLSVGEFDLATFDRLNPRIMTGDMKAIHEMCKLVFPYIYRHIKKKFGKVLDVKEYASNIYEQIYNFTVFLPKGRGKDYCSYTTQLKTVVERKLNQILKQQNEKIEESLVYNIPLTANEIIMEDLKREAVEDVLKLLNERERIVIVEYFGIDDGEEKTLKQVGKAMGIGRNTVYQLYSRALRKLQQPEAISAIKEY